MKIWVDAQLSPVIARWLANQLSIDVLHLASLNLIDTSDAAIFHAARAVRHLDHLWQYVQ